MNTQNTFQDRLGYMIARRGSNYQGLGDFALYMRIIRQHRQMDRQMLAQKTGIPEADIAFLEQGLLLPDELPASSTKRIERALGIPFPVFMAHNQGLLEQLRVQSPWQSKTESERMSQAERQQPGSWSQETCPEWLRALSELSVEALVAVSGPEQAQLLAELKRTETLKGMGAEQILALAAKKSPVVTQAFQEKFQALAVSDQQAQLRAMYEHTLEGHKAGTGERAGLLREHARQLQGVFERAQRGRYFKNP